MPPTAAAGVQNACVASVAATAKIAQPDGEGHRRPLDDDRIAREAGEVVGAGCELHELVEHALESVLHRFAPSSSEDALDGRQTGLARGRAW